MEKRLQRLEAVGELQTGFLVYHARLVAEFNNQVFQAASLSRLLSRDSLQQGGPNNVSTNLDQQTNNFNTETGGAMAIATPGYQPRAATGGPRPMDLQKRRRLGDTLVGIVLFLCGALSILTTISLVVVLLIESSKFFRDPEVTFWAFMSGTVWQPQILKFGVWPLLNATLMVSTIAMFVALPMGLMAAILLSEYAAPNVRATLKPILEILAGVPTVVYGYFALTFMTPSLRAFFEALGNISIILVAMVWGSLLLLSIGLILLGRRIHGAAFGRFLTVLGTLAALTLVLCTLAIVMGVCLRHIHPDLQHSRRRHCRRYPGDSAGCLHVRGCTACRAHGTA
jgi:ABC-type phosphate transport system permease subunit